MTFFVVIGLYVLYLLYLVVRAFVEMINSSHFGWVLDLCVGVMVSTVDC